MWAPNVRSWRATRPMRLPPARRLASRPRIDSTGPSRRDYLAVFAAIFALATHWSNVGLLEPSHSSESLVNKAVEPPLLLMVYSHADHVDSGNFICSTNARTAGFAAMNCRFPTAAQFQLAIAIRQGSAPPAHPFTPGTNAEPRLGTFWRQRFPGRGQPNDIFTRDQRIVDP